jgi:hypothetical protein
MSQLAMAAIVVQGSPTVDCSMTMTGMTSTAATTMGHSKRRSIRSLGSSMAECSTPACTLPPAPTTERRPGTHGQNFWVALEHLAYEEARRAIDRQSGSLDGLRGRAGILLAAISLRSGLLRVPAQIGQRRTR